MADGMLKILYAALKAEGVGTKVKAYNSAKAWPRGHH